MSHITVSPPSSLPSQASGPNSQLSTLSQCEWKRSIIPSQPNVFKDSNECNAVTQKMDFREGEGEKKKQSCVCGGVLSLYSPPLILSPSRLVCVLMAVCVCVCVHLPLSVCRQTGVPKCIHVNLYECARLLLIVCLHMCVIACACELKSPSRGNGHGLTGRPIVRLIKHFRFNTPSLSLTQTLAHHSFPPHFS